MPWNDGSSRDPSENLFSDLVLGTISTGVYTLGEVAKVGIEYLRDPEKVTANAKQFAQNFGKYTPNGREWFFNDPALGFSKYRQNAETQRQQLLDARYRRSQGIQTGFDDAEENRYDDRQRWLQRGTEKYYDNPLGDFAPDTDDTSALQTYKQLRQQASYADNSYNPPAYTPPVYTSYAALRRSLPDYEAPRYDRELRQREWAAKYPELDALAKESESFAKESESFAKDASARYQRFQSYADLRSFLNDR